MLIDNPTSENILRQIKQQNSSQEFDYLILCGEDAALDIPILIELLNNHEIRFCGGIFPGVIYGNQRISDKVLLLPVRFESDPVVIKGLDTGEFEIPALGTHESSGSLFILVDGLTSWISKFVFSLYTEIGSGYEVFGSGAGFNDLSRGNCIFSKDGFVMDSAVVVFLQNQIAQSIRHGWKTLAGPYLATKTTANVLDQINWEPAYEVYKKIVEKEEGIVLGEDNFREYAKHYPFGVFRSGAEHLIRDLVSPQEDGSILFGAEIPSNSVLYLMKSEIEDMLGAGQEVCMDALNKSSNPEYLFVAVCITRTWILGDQFGDELSNIASKSEVKDVPVFGVISLGEISSASGALLDYHHKTIVISILEHYG